MLILGQEVVTSKLQLQSYDQLLLLYYQPLLLMSVMYYIDTKWSPFKSWVRLFYLSCSKITFIKNVSKALLEFPSYLYTFYKCLTLLRLSISLGQGPLFSCLLVLSWLIQYFSLTCLLHLFWLRKSTILIINDIVALAAELKGCSQYNECKWGNANHPQKWENHHKYEKQTKPIVSTCIFLQLDQEVLW